MLIWANNFWSPKHLLPQYNRITHTVSEYIGKNQRQIPPRSLPQEKDGYNYEIYFLECKRTSCLHAKDFFCVQETKLQEGQIALDLPGYHQFWNYAEKKGYSGTAIFTKHEPLSVSYGIGIPEHDHEGRVITLESVSYTHLTLPTKRIV